MRGIQNNLSNQLINQLATEQSVATTKPSPRLPIETQQTAPVKTFAQVQTNAQGSQKQNFQDFKEVEAPKAAPAAAAPIVEDVKPTSSRIDIKV